MNNDEQHARRLEVLHFIRRHIAARCNQPTLREIVADTSVTSLCTARNDVQWLIERGWLVQTHKRPPEYTLPEIHSAARRLANQEADRASNLAQA